MIIQATVNWAFSKLNFKSQAPRLDLKGLSVNELSDVWDIYKWASQAMYNISCTDSVLVGNLFVHHFTFMKEEKVSKWPCKTMLDVLSKILVYHGKSLLEWKTTTVNSVCKLIQIWFFLNQAKTFCLYVGPNLNFGAHACPQTAMLLDKLVQIPLPSQRYYVVIFSLLQLCLLSGR